MYKITSLLFFLLCLSTYGQKSQSVPSKHPIASRTIIKSNLTVIKAAVFATKKNKKKPKSNIPHLGLAYDFQKKAVDLYTQKKHEQAIYHALQARKHAIMAIKQNRGRVADGHRIFPARIFKYFDKEEKFYIDLKDDFYNYDTTKINCIDSKLEQNVGKSTKNPDVKNHKEIMALDKLSVIR